MKNKLLFLLGAFAAFVFGSLAVYKLLNPYPCYICITGGSFHDLYKDNSEALQRGDAPLE